MKVLVCGSRDWVKFTAIRQRLAKLPAGTEIIEGGQRGADIMARDAANTLGLDYVEYGANWTRYSGGAGPIRNRKMLDLNYDIELVIAFPLPQSKGTIDMIEEAKKRGIRVEVYGEADA